MCDFICEPMRRPPSQFLYVNLQPGFRKVEKQRTQKRARMRVPVSCPCLPVSAAMCLCLLVSSRSFPYLPVSARICLYLPVTAAMSRHYSRVPPQRAAPAVVTPNLEVSMGNPATLLFELSPCNTM